MPTEHDAYERKAGALFANSHDLQKELAVQLSAMANSGGGHIILGQRDDGTFDGVPDHQGRTPTRQWFEQIIPNLTQYPLAGFRVHEVAVAGLPAGHCVIVIDVPDSHRAPHQAYFKGSAAQYYVRSGGHAVPAPHHFLDALHNRLTRIVLALQMERVWPYNAFHIDGQPILSFSCTWKATNESQLIASVWSVVPRHEQPDQRFRILTSKDVGNIPIDPKVMRDHPILPGRAEECITFFGLALPRRALPHAHILDFIKTGTVAGFAVSENWVGELVTRGIRNREDEDMVHAALELMRSQGMLQ